MARNYSLKYLLFAFWTLSSFYSYSQNHIHASIQWSKNTEIPLSSNNSSYLPESFKEAQFSVDNPLPFYSQRISINSFSKVDFQLVNYKSELIETNGTFLDSIEISPTIHIASSVIQERNNFFAFYSFTPFIKNSEGKIEKIIEFELKFTTKSKEIRISQRDPEFKENSVLKDGEIYKIAVKEDGLYKISYEDLISFGITPSAINPKNLKIFGNPGGPNPEAIAEERFDDLLENSIYVSGENDNIFNESDFILFYAHGPNSWKYSEINGIKYTHNIYDFNNYYYLTISNSEGRRIVDAENVLNNQVFSNSFDAYKRYEKDEYNLLSDFESTQGSGQLWFSEKFGTNRSQDFSAYFADPLLEISEDVKFEIQFASRSSSSSKLNFKIEDIIHPISFNSVSISNIDSRYADLEKINFTQKLKANQPTVLLDFLNSTAQSTGWLDYIQMEYTSKLEYNNSPIKFRKYESLEFPYFGFNIKSSNEKLTIWNISNVQNISNQKFNFTNNTISFSYQVNELNEYIAFDINQVAAKVEFINKIENQNLHNIFDSELLIVYHPNFEQAAKKIANHRSAFNDINTTIVPVDQVYNEFSSGKTDPTAIRNFARMIYTRDPNFKYLMLVGDGSFDYKHIRKNEYSNENFIPVYETKESFSPIESFPTDDFYALLDFQEGGNLVGGLDIAVGRLPVRTEIEANDLIDKLINYDLNDDSFSDWRLKIGFAGDDEDGNLHMRDADNIAENTRLKFKQFNVEKIYFDAFPQVSTPGGERYPQATAELNNNIFKGLLTLCYLGHGGPKGWAQERVLKLDDIENWDNKNKLPLLITATCSFTGFDDPKITSAGELALLKSKTGAIGLFSTVRAVYANQNRRLTQAVFDTIFSKPEGDYMRIGEILRRAKNSNQADTLKVNARKFLLVGDPSLKLALPEYDIITSSINGNLIDETYIPDTVKALQKIKFEGYIADDQGKLKSNFDGIVFCSVYDKIIQAKTLGNNTSSPPKAFNLQKTILFKGQSNVKNGKFSFEFYLPADINFEYGNGKISLYARSGNIDAAGSFENFIIGGSEELNKDDNPPIVKVFLNTEDFVFGGLSTSNPVLLARIEDDFGINVSGVSVGHDLWGELDGDNKTRFILNDYYESDIDNFRKGYVRYPLYGLSKGKHTLKVKAWDLSNNSGEGFTEFYVSDDIEESLKQVLNYPNPFSVGTTFQFEHNMAESELDILIRIYNMVGQNVKTLKYTKNDAGFRVDDLYWDGTSDYGEKIPNGIYLYKINVRSNQLGISKESNFEKLVLLK